MIHVHNYVNIIYLKQKVIILTAPQKLARVLYQMHKLCFTLAHVNVIRLHFPPPKGYPTRAMLNFPNRRVVSTVLKCYVIVTRPIGGFMDKCYVI